MRNVLVILCVVCFIGTNRTNAPARDNLMTGASLGYSGNYSDIRLNAVGTDGNWWVSTIRTDAYSSLLGVNTGGHTDPQSFGDKNLGRAVRYCNAERARSAY